MCEHNPMHDGMAEVEYRRGMPIGCDQVIGNGESE